MKAEFISSSEEDTIRIGEQLASNLEDGTVVLLYGAMGTGKTVLSKGIGKGLGCQDWKYIRSPSFTLINEHECTNCTLYHLDLYRLESERETEELGLRDFMGEKGTITVIEWAEKLSPLQGTNVVSLTIKNRFDNFRSISIVCHSSGITGETVE